MPFNEHMQFIHNAVHRYLHGAITDRWCEYGKVGRAIRFTDTGWVRIGQIFGWIDGIAMAGKEELANAMATNLVSHLDSLSNYGGTVDEPADGKKGYVPKYIIQFSDDGTLHGFGIQWFQATNITSLTAAEVDAIRKNPHIFKQRDVPYQFPTFANVNEPRCLYLYAMTGGFLYHGPGGDEVFAVTLGGNNTFWSTHT